MEGEIIERDNWNVGHLRTERKPGIYGGDLGEDSWKLKIWTMN